MTFVVRWTPTLPEIVVSLPTAEDVLRLTSELVATGSSDITVIHDGEPVEIASLRKDAAE
ncbi:hypothetical protein [Hansschlegelia sp. KR7-227]|jgi:hypothetical protein|uniref:hypothetical protein n=1 Tax=Hansschlegelia sp. KR7-227 TaxID=3400914 RepID=UPI003C0C98A0